MSLEDDYIVLAVEVGGSEEPMSISRERNKEISLENIWD